MVVRIVPVCTPAFHAYLNSCNAHVRNKRRGTSSEAANDIAVTGGCTDCHGGNLSGGPISGAPPEFPPAANLTPSGDLAHWSDADIVRALREGAPRRRSAQSIHALESHPLHDRRRNRGVDPLPAINPRPVVSLT